MKNTQMPTTNKIENCIAKLKIVCTFGRDIYKKYRFISTYKKIIFLNRNIGNHVAQMLLHDSFSYFFDNNFDCDAHLSFTILSK